MAFQTCIDGLASLLANPFKVGWTRSADNAAIMLRINCSISAETKYAHNRKNMHFMEVAKCRLLKISWLFLSIQWGSALVNFGKSEIETFWDFLMFWVYFFLKKHIARHTTPKPLFLHYLLSCFLRNQVFDCLPGTTCIICMKPFEPWNSTVKATFLRTW